MAALRLMLLLLLLHLGAAAANRTTPLVSFLLAGQSNMGGRGGATSGGKWDGVVPPECAPSPRILRLSPALRWEVAREPLHAGIDVGNVLGVGPGMPFAHAVLAACGNAVPAVGLVPCAQGGTPLANWTRGTELYDRMVTRARAAMGGGGELAAVLWYQGESDAESDAAAAAYRGNIERLIANVRADLGMPQLPFIQVMALVPSYSHFGFVLPGFIHLFCICQIRMKLNCMNNELLSHLWYELLC